MKRVAKSWKGLGIKLKIKLLNTCIFPIAMYGCEAWTLLESDMKKINSFEMQCYRNILGISWVHKITNENIRKALKIKQNTLLN